jgi:hypothetical protein
MTLNEIHRRRVLLISGGIPPSLLPNTFIGGVSSTITNKTLLAGFLSITDALISSFAIIGNDIECRITTTYQINSNAFYSVPEETLITNYIDLDGYCVAINAGAFRSTLQTEVLKELYFPNVTSVSGGTTFTVRSRGNILVYLPRCTTYGGAVTDNFTFSAASTHAKSKVYAEPTMATINGGGVEGDLDFLVFAGGVIVYVLNFTVPSDITDLATVSIGATYIKINWTAPASTNTIDYYEIYVDGIFNQKTTDLNIILALTNLSSYDITVKTVDIYYNKSTSNILSVTINGADINPLGNIISEWKVNSNSLDTIGANDGTDTSISYVAGLIGNCADFTAGTSSQISVADNESLSFGDGITDSPFSISFSVKFATVGNAVFLAKIGSTAATLREYQVFYNAGSFFWRLIDQSSGGFIEDKLIFTASAAIWYHFTLTYNGSGSNTGLKTYKDGVLQSTTKTLSGTYTAMEKWTAPVLLGKTAPNTTFSLNGYMDAVRLWDKELSASEVSSIAADELAGIDINI